jgi:hypothetical protein
MAFKRSVRPRGLCLKVGRGNATIITIQILQPRTASAGLLSLICCNRQRLSSLCTRLNVRFTLHPVTAGVGLCCFLLSSVFKAIVETLNSIHFLLFPYIRELEIPSLCRLFFYSCVPTYQILRRHIPHIYIIINGIKFRVQFRWIPLNSRIFCKRILFSGTALLAGRSRDRSPVVSLGIFSVATDGIMCPVVGSTSKNEYQGFLLG